MSTFRSPYPGYDVLAGRETVSWDDATRAVVDRRLHDVPERRFLDPGEWATLEAVCARLLPQPDRPDAPIPLAPWIDRMLEENRHDGYRFADMPPLREAWRLGLRGIEQESALRYGGSFPVLAAGEQDAVLRAVQCGEVAGEAWTRLPPRRFFAHTLLRTVAGIYYSHPAAWSEIGFGGPASPRGYVRLGLDRRDPWEAREVRDG